VTWAEIAQLNAKHAADSGSHQGATLVLAENSLGGRRRTRLQGRTVDRAPFG
jgi:hypothetical protein